VDAPATAGIGCSSALSPGDSLDPTIATNPITATATPFINTTNMTTTAGLGSLPPPPTVDRMANVLAILDANAHTLVAEETDLESKPADASSTEPTNSGAGAGVVGWGLFKEGCIFNHACSPNCDWRVTPMGMFEVRAAATIQPGESCTISFEGAVLDPNLAVRQVRRLFALQPTNM
jgi:hypothetical protein